MIHLVLQKHFEMFNLSTIITNRIRQSLVNDRSKFVLKMMSQILNFNAVFAKLHTELLCLSMYCSKTF